MSKTQKLNILSLFGGIECGRVAMDRLWWDIGIYYSSEFDKYPISQTKINFPDIIHLWDVRTVDTSKLEKIDILIWWSPCQDLSTAKSNGKWLDGEKSWLFFEYVRILRECNPKYFLLENVASMKKADRDKITEIMWVEPILINSCLVSAQNRKRLYWTNIPNIEQPEDKGILLKDIIEYVPFDKWKILEEKFVQKINMWLWEKCKTITASYDKWAYIKNLWTYRERTLIFWQFRRTDIRIHSEQNKSCTLTANMGTGGNNVPILLVTDKAHALTATYSWACPRDYIEKYSRQLVIAQDNNIFLWRKLTPIECERLQTLPDNFTKDLSDSRRYKAIGNGWTVDVISHILKNCIF